MSAISHHPLKHRLRPRPTAILDGGGRLCTYRDLLNRLECQFDLPETYDRERLADLEQILNGLRDIKVPYAARRYALCRAGTLLAKADRINWDDLANDLRAALSLFIRRVKKTTRHPAVPTKVRRKLFSAATMQTSRRRS